ncbi:MAG: hypothetical protein JO227_15390 [Acetobacteraceae bacterium]|nr:hypothetical protein [Acetobacteraceae bacterium]
MTLRGFVLLLAFSFIIREPALSEPVQFPSAAAPLSALKSRLARQHGFLPLPEPGDPIGGELYRPSGAGPVPAIIALHGCTGRLSPDAEAALSAAFGRPGYAVLWVDSFEPRGIEQQCNYTPEPVDRVRDVYGALDWLARQPFIDATRIAVLGLAEGATVALSTVSPSGYALHLSTNRFAVAIAINPSCYPGFSVVTAPTLVVTGGPRNPTELKECRTMIAGRTAGSAPEQLVVLPFITDVLPSETYSNKDAAAVVTAFLQEHFGN